MKVERKDLEKSQVELLVEMEWSEFQPFVTEGAKEISKEVKIDGFRPGKAPYEILKAKIGEMSILEKAANIAINRKFDQILKDNLGDDQAVGSPLVDITKLAPDNAFGFKISIALLPKTTLGEYKDLAIKSEEIKLDPKDVEKTIDTLRESRATDKLVDREAKEGDKLIIDLEMFLDSVPLESGKAQGMAVIMGQDNLIPGFDKQIAGMKKGEQREFKLPYPENFHQKNLAGKMVEFRVKAVDVFERQLPSADDSLAQAFGLKTFAELERNIKDGIEQEKKAEAERKTEVKIIEELIKKTKFSDIPELLINNEIETMISELERNIIGQGGKFEDYLSSIKKTRQDLMLDFTPDAIKRIKSALLIREVAKAEKIEISKEEIEKKRQEMLAQYKGYAKVEERISSPEYTQVIYNILSNQKVLNKLKDWNLKK